MNERIILLDFGSQYSHLIARRIRALGVYCEILPHTATAQRIRDAAPRGIILTGGPNSVYAQNAPTCSPDLLTLGIPVLGICYGAQIIAKLEGGTVQTAENGEYGRVPLQITADTPLFANVARESVSWMSHKDQITVPPAGFTVTASAANCPVAAMQDAERGIYAVQFHPEATHMECGQTILRNFLYDICKCRDDWKMDDYAARTIAELKAKIGDKKVLCALSGGVDSTVAAVMLHCAVGKQLTCIFVDHGLLRKNEAEQVEEICRKTFDMNLIRVDASAQFLEQLAGVEDPEQKRKIIGEAFIRVFEVEAKKLGAVDFFVQGTIYPDVIESGVGDSAVVIKSHHNVGGLPDVIDFEEIIEPLRLLFKDEVRQLGIALGIPENLVWRQPFPGPGLAVRVIGAITEGKLAILREADAIFREEIANAGLDREIGQYFAVLTNLRSVGVMGNFRTYDYTVGLRAVTTTDFMTADFAQLPYPVLETVSARIANEVPHVNRIVYDITPKPPATIEWE